MRTLLSRATGLRERDDGVEQPTFPSGPRWTRQTAELTDPGPRGRSGVTWFDAGLVALLITGAATLHLSVAGRIPSGGDGGNWLALAREMLGEQVMSAAVTYPPVFPGLVAALLQVLGPVEALLVAALAGEAVLVAAVYWCVRGAGRIPALTSAVLVVMAGYRLEAYAWGAYPQLLALGLGLLTVWSAVRFLRGGSRTDVAVALVGGVLVLSTHKLVGTLLLIAIPAAMIHAIWLEGFARAVRRRAAWLLGGLWALGALFVAMWLAEAAGGAEPALNPLGLSRLEQLTFSIREAPVPWLLAAVIGVVGAIIRSWPEQARASVSTGVGWAIAGIAGLVILGEPRTLIQAQVGLVPVAVLVVWQGWRAWAERPRLRRMAARGLLLAAAALAGSMVITGNYRYTSATAWYRVVGERELEALSLLAEASEPGDLVIASRGPNGNPIGWWVEGYAGRPTYTALDERFLAFPEEIRQAELAAEVFAASSVPGANLQEIGARFVVFDRRGPDTGWFSRKTSDLFLIFNAGPLALLEVDVDPSG